MSDLETLARLIHARRHRAGYGHTCDRCRAASAKTVQRA